MYDQSNNRATLSLILAVVMPALFIGVLYVQKSLVSHQVTNDTFITPSAQATPIPPTKPVPIESVPEAIRQLIFSEAQDVKSYADTSSGTVSVYKIEAKLPYDFKMSYATYNLLVNNARKLGWVLTGGSRQSEYLWVRFIIQHDLYEGEIFIEPISEKSSDLTITVKRK